MKTDSNNKLNRRNFLQVGVVGGLGLSLSQYLQLAEAGEDRKATADSVLFINLAGGVSHLDTLDMKPQAPAETQGEFKPIQTKIPGLTVCEHLPKLSQVIDQFTLIRGIGHSAGAHPQAQSWLSTGNRPTPALIYPSFGSVVMKELPTFPDMPSYVAIPKTEWNAGYMGDAYGPFKTNAVPQPGKPFLVRGISLADGLTLEKVNQREKLLSKLDRTFRAAETESQLLDALDKFGKQAYSMITSARARQAFDVNLEDENLRKQFGTDEFNQGLLLGCRLIEFGVKFVTLTYAGWDTHLDNFNKHRALLKRLDQGLPAMLNMLSAKGLLDRTLVIVMGEFGRTPKINQNAGRDHYPRVNWSLMTGGGVKSGQLIGASDKKGETPTDGTDITPDDLAASLYHSLGIDPLTEYYTKTNRPALLVPEGRVMTKLFA